MPMPGRSMGIAPKELMASTTNVLPNSLAAWPIGSIGLSMPLVVSQCTTTTCVIAGSAASAARTSAAAGGCDSAYLSVVSGDRLHGGHLGDPLAVGPVDQHQEFALRRRDGSHHGFQPERSAALHENGLVALRLRDARRGQQRPTDAGDDLAELAVPRSHVAEHRLLDRLARRQRAGCKQEQVAGGREAGAIGHGCNLTIPRTSQTRVDEGWTKSGNSSFSLNGRQSAQEHQQAPGWAPRH